MNAPWMVVSLHDVAPCTAEDSTAWMRLLEARGVRASVLVVPGPWRGATPLADAPDFAGWLRDLEGDGHEIVQHGWEHVEPSAVATRGPVAAATGRLIARGCAEFWHLDHAEASRRLAAGRRVLADAGLHVNGFIAPGWLLSPAATSAVRDAGFRYTTTHRAVVDLATNRDIPCAALSQRPGSRLAGAAAALTTRLTAWSIRTGRPLRIAAHPADRRDRRAVRSVLDACDAALAAGYRSTTYADVQRSRR